MFHKKIHAKVTKVLNKKGAKKTKKKVATKEKPLVEDPEKLVAKVINNVPDAPNGYDFKVGSKFMLGDYIYIVKAHYEDANTRMVKVYSADNGEEIYNLDTLKKDANDDPTFQVIHNG
jgi:hypothetical protein